MDTLHGTCVVIEGMGVLIRGPSGSGKSDLALRLLERGARLVADDQVHVSPAVNAAGIKHLIASPPPNLMGLLEVRSLGVVRLPAAQTAAQADLALIVDLCATGQIDRMPDPAWAELAGVTLPKIDLAGFEVSAPAKLAMALHLLRQPRARVEWVGV